MLACALTDQARAMGDTINYLELWVERMIQLVKHKVKFRTTCAPEQVIVNDLEFRLALGTLKNGGGTPCLSMPELGSSNVHSSTEPSYDASAHTPAGSSLCGKGRLWDVDKDGDKDDMVSRIKKMLSAYVGFSSSQSPLPSSQGNVDGWTSDLLAQAYLNGEAKIWVHERVV